MARRFYGKIIMQDHNGPHTFLRLGFGQGNDIVLLFPEGAGSLTKFDVGRFWIRVNQKPTKNLTWKNGLTDFDRIKKIQQRLSGKSASWSSVLNSKYTPSSVSFWWFFWIENLFTKVSGSLLHWANNLNTLSLFPSFHNFLISSETL